MSDITSRIGGGSRGMYYKGREVKELGHDGSDLHGFGEQIRKELYKRIPRNGDIKVLDVGTGFAITTEFLARALPDGSRIWTLDPSGEVLQHARRSLKARALIQRLSSCTAASVTSTCGMGSSI